MSDVGQNQPGRVLELEPAQKARLQRFRTSECVDIHCHCLPGLDDGPETLEHAIDLCRELVDDGITTVIATPHQLGRYDGRNWASQVRQAVDELSAVLAAEQIPLVVKPGADVRIDERLCELLSAGQVLTLADTGKYVLLELEHDSTIEPQELLTALISDGRIPILSHPERNRVLNKHVESVLPWIEHGALLQVTAASLTGFFGPVAEKIAWQWLGRGYAQVVATDSHDVISRRPVMSKAIDLAAKRLTHSITRRTFIENPMFVLNGQLMPGWNGADSSNSRGANIGQTNIGGVRSGGGA